MKMLLKAFNSTVKTGVLSVVILFGLLLFYGCDQRAKNYEPKVLEEARVWKSKIESDIQFAVDEIRKIALSLPISHDGNIVGAAGLDLSLLEFFKPIIRRVRVLDIAYGFLVDNNGVMIAHPINWVNVGRSLEFFAFEPTVIQAVKDGREASQIKISKTTGNRNYYQFVPVKIGSIDKPWSLVISLRPDWLNGRGPKVSW